MAISHKDRRRIFGLCRHLGLDDEERRALQLHVTGKASSKDMTPRDAGIFIRHLSGRAGRRAVPKRAGRIPNNFDSGEPQLAKIEALLADMQLSWQYAEAIAWRITGGHGKAPNSQPGVKRLEWVTRPRDLQAIIAALHVEQEKRANVAAIELELQRLNRSEEWLHSKMPSNWQFKWRRNRKQQKAILQFLGVQPEGHRA